MARRFIPVAAPHIDEEDVAAVTAAVRSGWISSIGPKIPEFEAKFAKYAGVTYALAASNGTVALHLALAALGIGPGDEVIVPDLTFVATANAVAYTGATPVMVDVDPVTWCMSPAAFEAAITKRTKAVMPVHLYGQPADMKAILAIAAKRRLRVVEDAAEAHGARIGKKMVGGFGDIGVFSFYGNKIITTGEGGMVTTNDKRLYEKMRALRNQGAHPTKKYWYTQIGFNYRLTNLQTALGLSQLRRIEKFIARKQAIAAYYRKALGDLPGVQVNPVVPGTRGVFWMSCLVLDTPARRAGLMRAFGAAGIESRPFFAPVSELPMYRRRRGPATPVTHRLSARGMNLPSGVDISEADLKHVVRTVRSYLER